MAVSDPTLAVRAWRRLLGFIPFMAVLVFLPAGTLHYWQGWLYLALFFACCALTTASLLKRDSALVARRLDVGPQAEREPAQKRIQWFAGLSLCALYIVSGLDWGRAWSFVPVSVVLIGDLLMVLGFAVMYRVFRENSYAAATVTITEGQRVIASGPYARVRHPMYSGVLLMFLGTPLALGSWWGLAAFIPTVAVLIARLRDEEQFLMRNLAGYGAYRDRVRFRLLPGLW
ncbi:methyltransferase family protein [Dongia sp.]|uniref:methyltransferase family protein n=1 Tax=Dongia sp. TaxID=1977262 RepID=UPI003750E4DE